MSRTSHEGRRTRVAIIHDYLSVAEELADWSSIREHADVDFFSEPFASEDDVVAALADYDVIGAMRERLPLTATLMDRLPRLRLFVATSEVNRQIDFQAARERGIVVAGTPSGAHARVATAELTWGLILAATRNIVHEDAAVRDGLWQTRVPRALHGQTIGIVGLGGTGRYIARFARAFGMRILAFSPHLSDMDALEAGAERVSLATLLEQSDVVSLHLVLSDTTHHLIDSAALGRMKSSAVLINTSRGGLVDEAALVDALQREQIAGAALDTFDVEPLPTGHPLLDLTNVILSPHSGGFTRETYETWYRGTVDAVLAFLEGRTPPVTHRQP